MENRKELTEKEIKKIEKRAAWIDNVDLPEDFKKDLKDGEIEYGKLKLKAYKKRSKGL